MKHSSLHNPTLSFGHGKGRKGIVTDDGSDEDLRVRKKNTQEVRLFSNEKPTVSFKTATLNLKNNYDLKKIFMVHHIV